MSSVFIGYQTTAGTPNEIDGQNGSFLPDVGSAVSLTLPHVS
jgi:hypothetical protein